MSVPRLNAAANHQMTGEELQNLAAAHKSPGMKVFITQNSPDNAFVASNYYTLSNDLTSWSKDGLSNHLHTTQDDGGRLSETLKANIPTTIDYDKRWARVASFFTHVTSGGTVTDDSVNARINISTSTTTNSKAHIYDGGARELNFAVSSAFESTLQQDSATNFKTKVGINAENVENANSNIPSYGIEGCSSSGTVWLVWSANGTTRSTVTTSASIAPANPVIYLVEHETANSITLTANGTFVAEKTTHVPSSGLAASYNLYKAGIQTLTTAAKTLRHYGGPRIVGGT
jgi:hypothetical protein